MNTKMLKKTKVNAVVSEEGAVKTKKVKKTAEVVVDNSLMGKFITESANMPKVGDVLEGPVLAIEKTAIYIDLKPYGTGIIYGREYISAKDVIKKMNIGDSVSAKVIDTDNTDGYIELSLKEARQALIWSEAELAIKNKTVLELPVLEANKGGLLIEWQGIVGFLPASQLGTTHYPRVLMVIRIRFSMN